MLAKLKLALQISGNVLDAELNDLINAAVIDLGLAGIADFNVESADAILTRAIISYCVYQFEMVHGSLERSQALKRAYDENKAMLSMSTSYNGLSNNG